MSYFTLKNGMKLYYEDTGSGQPVVFMHGWTSSHRIYAEPIRKLQKYARCISYDHRGHDKSKNANAEPVTLETLADDLNELLTGLSLRGVTLVGWSMGAAVAMSYIKKYGCTALRQVVFCDMTPRQRNDEDWKLGLYKGQFSAEDEERNRGQEFLDIYTEFALGAMPRLKKLHPKMLRLILKSRLRRNDEGVLKNLSASMKAADLRDMPEYLNVPAAYFYAKPGSLFSPELEKWYRNHIKQVPFTAVAFPQSTHMMIDEHPAQFAEELKKLL